MLNKLKHDAKNIDQTIIFAFNNYPYCNGAFSDNELKQIIKTDPYNFRHIPREYRTKELCEIAVIENGLNLQSVPVDLITENLCKLAVISCGLAFQCVPHNFRTKKLCEFALTNNAAAFGYLPIDLKENKSFIKKLLTKNWRILLYIPQNFITYEMCKIAIKQSNEAFSYIPLIHIESIEKYVRYLSRKRCKN